MGTGCQPVAHTVRSPERRLLFSLYSDTNLWERPCFNIMNGRRGAHQGMRGELLTEVPGAWHSVQAAGRLSVGLNEIILPRVCI